MLPTAGASPPPDDGAVTVDDGTAAEPCVAGIGALLATTFETPREPARSRFSGRCTIMWTSLLDFVPKDSLHTSHLYGLICRWMS